MLKRYLGLHVARASSALFFMLCEKIQELSLYVNSNWTNLQLINSLIQIIVFALTYIMFYRFLLKLKTVQIQIDPKLETPEEVFVKLVRVHMRVRLMTFIIISGFVTMIISTILFTVFGLYEKGTIYKKVASSINLVVSAPSILIMFYFLYYFFKMGDGYVKILSYQYSVSVIKYRLITGTMFIVLIMGWSNSILVYIYLPLQLLLFDQDCTLDFLKMAQKLLVFGHFQPTTMGLLMLLIIMYFAKDE